MDNEKCLADELKALEIMLVNGLLSPVSAKAKMLGAIARQVVKNEAAIQELKKRMLSTRKTYKY